jgi:hypothetical protein
VPWPQALKIAAGIGSMLSLCAFLGVLYTWLASRRSERSVVETVRGQGIVEADTVVRVLKQFDSDDKRIEALHEMLGYDRERASDVVAKVKADIDVEALVVEQHTDSRKWLLIVSMVLIIFTLAAFVASNRAEGAKLDSTVERIAVRLGFEKSEPDVLSAIDELKQYARRSSSPRITDQVAKQLRPLVLSHSDTTSKARQIRKAAIEAIKIIRENRMRLDFSDGLIEADLPEVDLSGADLSGVNLSGSFLMGSDFAHSSLIGANLSDADLRNVNFAGADLTNTNLSNADWFNALGLTRDQIYSTWDGSAPPCPDLHQKNFPLKHFLTTSPQDMPFHTRIGQQPAETNSCRLGRNTFSQVASALCFSERRSESRVYGP